MPKFTFVCEHLNDDSTQVERRNTVEFTADTWYDVLAEVQDFLRGSGYYFDGDVTVVDPNEDTGCCGGCDEDLSTFSINTSGSGATTSINTDNMFSSSDTITLTTGHSPWWNDSDRNR